MTRFEDRQFQLDAIGNLRAEYERGRKAPLLVSPTGSGKTVMATQIIQRARELGNRVVMLAHREELIDQTVKTLDEFGVYAGVIKAGRPADPLAPVQVASVQTLINREMPAAKLLIIDEAHHAAADSYREISRHYDLRLGLTATPWRVDGRGLADDFDSVVVAATPAELTAKGFLVRAKCYAYTTPDLKGMSTRGGDYKVGGLEVAYDKREILGSIVGEYAKHTPGRPAIVFPPSVKISLQIVAEFRAAGFRAAHVDADTPTDQRKAILDLFRVGGLHVLSSVGVLTEGFDAPRAEVCILARPTVSLALFMQMIGRVLRPFRGKEMAVIHDHSGNCIVFGLPTDERDYSLEATRKKAAPLYMACPMCMAVIPLSSRECPNCGEVLRVEKPAGDREQLRTRTKDVERVDIEALRVERARHGLRALSPEDLARVARCTRSRQCEEYLRLRLLCESRGWAPSTADRFYRQTFGKLPDFSPDELAAHRPAHRPLVSPPVKTHAA